MAKELDLANLVDKLRPPEGYVVDQAFATTYSLDFPALTAALLALANRDCDEDIDASNKVEVLEAIMRLKTNVRIFVDRGHISGRKMKGCNALAALFDTMIKTVRLENVSFHPKVWLVRYRPKDVGGFREKPARIRVICTSRNLTCSHCWEIYACFDGDEQDHGGAGSRFGKQAANFLRKVTRQADPEVNFNRLLNGLEASDFQQTPAAKKRCDFLFQTHDSGQLWDHFPAQGKKAVLVSPFLDSRHLLKMVERFQKVTIVTSRQELDKIQESGFHEHLKERGCKVYVAAEGPALESEESSFDLHAKVYLCEGEGVRTTFLGSANASNRGWCARNWESIVALEPGIEIEHFLKDFILDEEGQLRPQFEEYMWSASSETEDMRIGQQLENLLSIATGVEIAASYNQKEKRLSFKSKSALDQALKDATGFSLTICPMSLDDDTNHQPFADLDGKGIRYDGVEVAKVTKLVMIRATHRASEQQRIRVVTALGLPDYLLEERDQQAPQNFIHINELEAYLRAILFDKTSHGTRPPAKPQLPGDKGLNGKHEQNHAWGDPPPRQTLLGDLTLEKMLRAFTEDPSRFERIDQLFSLDAWQKAIDPSTRQFWTEFKQAWRQVQPKGAR